MNSNYNYFEKAAARFLTRFPFLKRVAKLIYSKLIYFIYKKKEVAQYLKPFSRVTYSDHESFFGYYDKTPENVSGKILYYRTESETRQLPESSSCLFLCVYCPEENKEIVEIPLFSYNWQQGARAQWLAGELFIFNQFDSDWKRYISVVYSAESCSEIKRFDLPVQDSFRTDFFVSLNYSRIMSLRPDYGYRNLPCLTSTELQQLSDDGLWKVDFKTGKSRLLVSLADICNFKNKNFFSEAFHEINHVMISPSGNYCIFIHRYYLSRRRFDRLFLVNVHSAELRLLADNEMVSHCCWVDAKNIFGYLRGPTGLDGYWVIDCVTGEFSRFSNHLLEMYGDGHPHCHGNKFVTDSYPDKSRMQHLFLGDLKTGEVTELGRYKHGFDFSGECRCDLHPRLSPDGKRVYFDSVFSGKRQLYFQDISG